MLVDGILAGEAGVNEQIRELLRIDFGSRSNVERGAEQSLGTADAGQEGRG